MTGTDLAPYLPKEATDAAESRGLLSGRTVLVIGGGQQTHGLVDPPIGIGRAISQACAREGAAVAITDIDSDAAANTADECRRWTGQASAHTGDASQDQDAARVIDEALAHHGTIDGLVLNVGVAGGDRFADTTSVEWDRVMAINARSHFLAIKYTLPHLRPGSAVVLISSAAWRMPSSMDFPAYAASKGALTALASYAAREAATRRVRVNSVVPSLIDTSLARLADLVKPDRATTPIPLGRQGTAWEVANAAIFLLADTSSYITGQQLLVDGGLVNVP